MKPELENKVMVKNSIAPRGVVPKIEFNWGMYIIPKVSNKEISTAPKRNLFLNKPTFSEG